MQKNKSILIIISLENKPGSCPVSFVAGHEEDRCSRECHTDAQCRGPAKCCQNGCSIICTMPSKLSNLTELLTTVAPNITGMYKFHSSY